MAPTMPKFENDDACGDWVVGLGHSNFQVQCVNAATALLFVAAGAPLMWKAETPVARGYGFMMCCVGIGSMSFHGTSSLMGFMIDIVPMAVAASLMLFRALHGLQVEAGFTGPKAEAFRFYVTMGAAFVAVYMPWLAVELGISHFKVWGLWAFLFGSMGTFYGVTAAVIYVIEDVFWGPAGRTLAVSAASIILGVGFTVHSFMPGLCTGWRSQLPLHALWHFFSSISSNRCGQSLDTLTKLVHSMESAIADGSFRAKDKDKRHSLLLRMVRDALPSQFSM